MKLKCTSDYRNGSLGVHYEEGAEIDVEDERGHWLMADSPGSFERVQAKAPDAPAENKMVSSAPDRKDLETHTVTALQDIAREHDVVYSGLRKDELIDALLEVLGG